jgi:hypothetical protein
VGETDIHWRRLLREAPEAFVRIAFPHRPMRVLGPANDASVDRVRRLTADNLIRVRDGNRTRLLHIEVEPKWRPSLPRRLFDYASSAHVTLTAARRDLALQLLFLAAAAMLGAEVARSAFVMDWLADSPGVRQLIREYQDEGRVMHARAALLRLLRRRKLAPSPEVVAQIEAESDLEQLDAWFDAAITAVSADKIFRRRRHRVSGQRYKRPTGSRRRKATR